MEIGHISDECDIVTLRIENRNVVFSFPRKNRIYELLRGIKSSVSGNYWYGIQPLRNWFLLKVRGDAGNVRNILTTLCNLQESGDITGWDFDNNGGNGRLQSCNKCGTKKVDCNREGLPEWHHHSDRVRCPKGGDARNDRTLNARHWMNSKFSEDIIGRMSMTQTEQKDTAEEENKGHENNAQNGSYTQRMCSVSV